MSMFCLKSVLFKIKVFEMFYVDIDVWFCGFDVRMCCVDFWRKEERQEFFGDEREVRVIVF